MMRKILIDSDYVIHVLRNPWGREDEMREIRLDAADLIERYKDAYENMRQFVQENGLAWALFVVSLMLGVVA